MWAEDSFLSLFDLRLVESQGHGRLIALGAKASDWVQWRVWIPALWVSRAAGEATYSHLERCLGMSTWFPPS